MNSFIQKEKKENIHHTSWTMYNTKYCYTLCHTTIDLLIIHVFYNIYTNFYMILMSEKMMSQITNYYRWIQLGFCSRQWKKQHEQRKTKIDIDEFRSGTTNITLTFTYSNFSSQGCNSSGFNFFNEASVFKTLASSKKIAGLITQLKLRNCTPKLGNLDLRHG